MKITQTQSTTASLIEIFLEKEESIRIEPGAMVYKDLSIEIEGKMNGSNLFSAITKKFFTGESFFTTIAKTKDSGKIAIAPKGFGNIKVLNIQDTQWYLNDGVFLACNTTVNYKTNWQKSPINSLFSKNGGFLILKTSGKGELIVSGFGDLIEIELDGTKPFQIDNGHVVCWEETLDYHIQVASGIFGFKTGEGLLNTFNGKGKIIIQTRNIQAFLDMITPFLSSYSALKK